MSNLDNNPNKPAKTDPQLTRPSLHTHLDQVLAGDLGPLVEALQAAELADRLGSTAG